MNGYFFQIMKAPRRNNFLKILIFLVCSFWEEINAQIRIKAKIRKTKASISDEHFSKRSQQKNALAISSRQSKEIDLTMRLKEILR